MQFISNILFLSSTINSECYFGFGMWQIHDGQKSFVMDKINMYFKSCIVFNVVTVVSFEWNWPKNILEVPLERHYIYVS